MGGLRDGGIYDDGGFFEKYALLRADPLNYNDMFEQPVMHELIGSCRNEYVLDVGCGTGGLCRWLSDEGGAACVVGIDPSSKMLDVARFSTDQPNVEYRRLDAGSLSAFELRKESFDLITSSLALHYVEDFAGFAESAYKVLNPHGRLVFSQEHPIYTASIGASPKWDTGEDGKKESFCLEHYSRDGQREAEWLGTRLVKYHRKMSTIVNTLRAAGFAIDALWEEPVPDDALVNEYERTRQELHRPAYLMISAYKR